MKFLSVFCVVLCLHSRETTSTQNNLHIASNQAPTKNITSQTNQGGLDNQYTSDIIRYTAQTNKENKDPVHKPKDITIRSQGFSSNLFKKNDRNIHSVQDPEATKLSRILLYDLKSENSENLKNEKLVNPDDKTQLSHNLPQDAIRNTVSIPHKNNNHLNSNRDIIKSYQDQPIIQQLQLNPNEETRLEVEGVTLEDVKSSLSSSSQGSTSELQPHFINSKDNGKYTYVQYILDNAKNLQHLHSTAENLKRYMIVHPDGTIEHTDYLVAESNPNYIAVRSTDLKKLSTATQSLINEKLLDVSSLIVSKSVAKAIKQNLNKQVLPEKTFLKSTKYDKPNKNIEHPIKEKLASTVMTHTVEDIEPQLNSQSKQISSGDVKVKNLVDTVQNVTDVSFQNYTSQMLSPQDLTGLGSTELHKSRDKPINNELSTSLNSNLLPILVAPLEKQSNETLEGVTDNVKATANKLTLIKNKNDKQNENFESTTIQDDIDEIERALSLKNNEISTGDVNVDNLDNIVLNATEDSLSNYLSEPVSPTDKINTIPEDIDINSELNILDNSTSLSPNVEIPLNDDVSDDFESQLSSTNSPEENSADIDYSEVWFQDRQLWDELKNNKNNVFYFMTFPTAPPVQKETKTTVFVNGTIVEEVTEIVDGEDGFPVALKTTMVTHAAADGDTSE